MNPDLFKTTSLEKFKWCDQITHILAAAFDAVEPGVAVAHHMKREGDTLLVNNHSYLLNRYQRIFLIGAGKAGESMAHAATEILGERLTQGIIIVKDGYKSAIMGQFPKTLEILEASHPLPDKRGITATRKIISLLDKTNSDDLVICLISGGGSALLTQPIIGVSLDDLRILTNSMLDCGATINEINTLRKHIEQVKGGQLALLASPAQLITLILSDVIANPLDSIASGPTVPDPSTFSLAIQILDKYHLVDKIPRSISNHLLLGEKGEIEETPKPNDLIFHRVQNILVGSNEQAIQAALIQASKEGFKTKLLTTSLIGEAQEAGKWLGSITSEVASIGQPICRPACLVAGGETTVTIHGNGLGGRNQEMALAAVRQIAGLQDIILVTLATDGGDGPTDAAGAVVTCETLARAEALGLDPDDFLSRNDSYHFFALLGDLIKTGPTYTNVNDLAFIFAF